MENTIEHLERLLEEFRKADPWLYPWDFNTFLDNETVEPLLKALKNPEPRVRAGVLLALGELRDERAFEDTLKALQDKNSKVRLCAVIALGNLADKKAVSSLLERLTDKNVEVREHVIKPLGKLEDPIAINQLIQILKKDKNWIMRSNAASALTNFPNQQIIQPLMEALKDKNQSVHRAAALGLSRLGDPQAIEALVNNLRDYPVGHTTSSLITAVRAFGESAIPSLLKALTKKKLRGLAAYTLGHISSAYVLDEKITEEIVTALIRVFHYKSSDVKIREYIIQGLGLLKNEQISMTLLQTTSQDKDQPNLIRAMALHALGKFGLPVLPILVKALNDNNISWGAIEGIKRVGPVAIPSLLEVLKSQNSRVRANATFALGLIIDSTGTHWLINMLQDKSPEVRGQTVSAINRGLFEDRLNVELLVQPLAILLNDDDVMVRHATIHALGHINDEKVLISLLEILNKFLEDITFPTTDNKAMIEAIEKIQFQLKKGE